jgi:hypothetical protein
MTDLLPTCRICLSQDDFRGLCAPCNCRGTAEYVHLRCQLNWALTCTTEKARLCDVCKFEFVPKSAVRVKNNATIFYRVQYVGPLISPPSRKGVMQVLRVIILGVLCMSIARFFIKSVGSLVMVFI